MKRDIAKKAQNQKRGEFNIEINGAKANNRPGSRQERVAQSPSSVLRNPN